MQASVADQTPPLTPQAVDKLKSALRAEMPLYLTTLNAIKKIADQNAFWVSVSSAAKSAQKRGLIPENLSPEAILNAVIQTSAGDLLWLLNKSVNDPYQRMGIANAAIATAPAIMCDLGADAPLANEFKQTGFLKLPELLNPTQVQEMAKYLNSRSYFVHDGPTHSNIIQDIVETPHALAFATHPRVLNLVQHYLGGPPTILDLCAWWTTPSETDDYGAHIFHRDKDDFRACKMFMYLTDVETEDGPHIFARYTHDPEFTKSYLEQNGLSPDLMKPLFEGNGRHVADAIPKLFGNHIFEVTGKAGTSFLEGTYGFHRGKTAKRHRRGLYQVMYGSLPYPTRLERFAPVALEKLPPDCVDNEQTRFAARFLFKSN